MRAYIPLLLTAVVLSCSDIPDSELQLQPTEMIVTVIDENQKPVKDADVYLYRDYLSFLTKTGEVAYGTTTQDGKVKFSDLEPFNYYIYASHIKSEEFYDNSTLYYNLADFLTENAITTITVKTAYLRSVEPLTVTLNSIDFLPFTKNKDWVGKTNDTLHTEFLIIENYDADNENPYTQNIVARSTIDFYGKTEYGKEMLQSFPSNDDSESLTMTLSELQESSEETDPSLKKYTLFVIAFTDEDDFENRELIYNGDIEASDYKDDFYVSLSDFVLKAADQQNAYPQKLFVGESNSFENNYYVFFNFSWQ